LLSENEGEGDQMGASTIGEGGGGGERAHWGEAADERSDGGVFAPTGWGLE